MRAFSADIGTYIPNQFLHGCEIKLTAENPFDAYVWASSLAWASEKELIQLYEHKDGNIQEIGGFDL